MQPASRSWRLVALARCTDSRSGGPSGTLATTAAAWTPLWRLKLPVDMLPSSRLGPKSPGRWQGREQGGLQRGGVQPFRQRPCAAGRGRRARVSRSPCWWRCDALPCGGFPRGDHRVGRCRNLACESFASKKSARTEYVFTEFFIHRASLSKGWQQELRSELLPVVPEVPQPRSVANRRKQAGAIHP